MKKLFLILTMLLSFVLVSCDTMSNTDISNLHNTLNNLDELNDNVIYLSTKASFRIVKDNDSYTITTTSLSSTSFEFIYSDNKIVNDLNEILKDNVSISNADDLADIINETYIKSPYLYSYNDLIPFIKSTFASNDLKRSSNRGGYYYIFTNVSGRDVNSNKILKEILINIYNKEVLDTEELKVSIMVSSDYNTILPIFVLSIDNNDILNFDY